MQIEIYISDKLIKPFGEDEKTSYKLAWKGTTRQLKINSTEDDKILEAVFFKFNSERPADCPGDLRTFSVGDVVCIGDKSYRCLAEGWQTVDNFSVQSMKTNIY